MGSTPKSRHLQQRTQNSLLHGELGPGGLGELGPGGMGELDPGRHGGAQPRPAAAPRLAVDGGDGHGELGPGGLGELGGGGQEELYLSAAMEGARPRRPGGGATARTSSAPAAWRSSTPAAMGELNPGLEQLPASRLAAATAMASSTPAAWESSTFDVSMVGRWSTGR